MKKTPFRGKEKLTRRRARTRLRISGVVKAMNQAREQLGYGISQNEQAQFCQWVMSVTGQVEAICRQHKLSPAQLSSPTYRAYLYLKNINLQDLPSPNGPTGEVKAGQAGRKVRIPKLVAHCSQLQARLSDQAIQPVRIPIQGERQPEKAAKIPEFEELQNEILATVGKIEMLIEKDSDSLSGLPNPTHRAYLWLKFLSEPESLQAHLNALRLAWIASQAGGCQKKVPSKWRKLPIQVEFYNIRALYRMRIQKGSMRITANEGFIHAPERVLQALICAALKGNDKEYLSEIRAYAENESFLQISRVLESSVVLSEPLARGQIYDLRGSFDRVNAGYFEGAMERPRLTWNKTITHRKLGHYQPATDTVMISITLDHPRIPEWVLDFVMYHELLHKKLGTQEVNGRRYAHNKAFRAEERKFNQYEQAQEFFKGLQPYLPGNNLSL